MDPTMVDLKEDSTVDLSVVSKEMMWVVWSELWLVDLKDIDWAELLVDKSDTKMVGKLGELKDTKWVGQMELRKVESTAVMLVDLLAVMMGMKLVDSSDETMVVEMELLKVGWMASPTVGYLVLNSVGQMVEMLVDDSI
jgi:hypothetical protein